MLEFIFRKNHKFIIESLNDIKDSIPNIKIIFAGKGELLEECIELVKTLNLENDVYFLGYRNDINILCQISDVLISSSFQDGLPINIIEGMASRLPIVCANIRGQTDLIANNKNGYLYNIGDSQAFKDAIISLYNNLEQRNSFGRQNVLDARKYSLDKAIDNMSKIYKQFM